MCAADPMAGSFLDALVTGQLPDERLRLLPALEEYRLLRRIGQGAMGCVYLAHDALLDRPVAIKFLAGLAHSAAARQRFLTEARAIARLTHPHVVSIYRSGEWLGHPFLVSEYVRGQSLERLERPLPAARVRELGLGLARGLAAAHRRGVLHRDLKPANAMLTEDGSVKLLDFGLAKLLDPLVPTPSQPPSASMDLLRALAPPAPSLDVTQPPDDNEAGADGDAQPLGLAETAVSRRDPSSSGLGTDPDSLHPSEPAAALTRVGAVMGTPLYMAPEVWRGEPATVRSDLYSLGAVLYELWAGRPPHSETTEEALREAALTRDAPPLAVEKPGARAAAGRSEVGLAQVIRRCLQRDAAARYGSAEEICQALEQLYAQDGPQQQLAPGDNPYRGLRPFEAGDSALFFGRSAEVAEVLERLRSEPLVLVAGDSGVGKSSLCRAGVLARLGAGWGGEPARRYDTVTLFPGRYPAVALSALLAPIVGTGSGSGAPDELRHQLLDQPHELARRLQRHVSARRDRGLLLFIDQVEELLTQSEPTEAAAVSELLGRLAARVDGLRVLLTTRGDFLTRLAALPGLGPEIGRALYILRPLSRDGLREAIVGPAESRGVRFESPALVTELVESTLREGGGLPLLQFALAELWQARKADTSVITTAALRGIGGVPGALARHADRVLAELLPPQRSAAKRLLLHLVSAAGMRSRRSRAELLSAEQAGPADATALEALVRGRLLVAREADGGTVYEIAHEALVSGWPALRDWIFSETERRALRERLGAAASEWRRLFESEEALWGDRQLGELALVGLGDGALSEAEAAFLHASRRRARRQRWGGRLLGGALASSLLVLALVGWQAGLQRQRADSAQLQRERSQHIELGSVAMGLSALPGGEVPALVSAIQATAPRLLRGQIPEPQALEGLSAAVQTGARSLPLRGHRGTVGSACFSPDGSRILTAGWDGTLRLWDARTGEPLRQTQAHAPAVSSARFSADGGRIATISADRTAGIFDGTSLRPIARLQLDEEPLAHTLSPDGSRLVITTGAHGRETHTALWDALGGRRIARWPGLSRTAPPGPFSPDGQRLVVGAAEGEVGLYDARTGDPLATLRVGRSAVVPGPLRAGYSADGRQILASAAGDDTVYAWEAGAARPQALRTPQKISAWALGPESWSAATAEEDLTVRLWDLRTSTLRAALPGHSARIHELAFSTDGRLLASAGAERGIRLWDTERGLLLDTLRGHGDVAHGLSFSADGARLLSASSDGSARIWSLLGGQHLLRLAHPQSVTAATYSPDGRHIATASKDPIARVFDAETGRPVAALVLPDEVSAVAFAPGGEQLATARGGGDHAIWIWDWRERRTVAMLHGHAMEVLSVAFSPDGQLVASAGRDTTVRVFRWRTRELLWKANAGRTGALVVHVGFSPDGRRLATSDWQGRVRIFGAESGQLVLTNSSDTERPSAVAFSPDGALLAIAGLRPYLVDVQRGTILRELRGHLAATTALSFSRDGQRIATLSADQTARIFDTATAQTVHLLRVGAASSLELSPSGDRLLIAHHEDRSAKIYPASPQALLTMACALILPQPEWEQVRPLCQGSMK